MLGRADSFIKTPTHFSPPLAVYKQVSWVLCHSWQFIVKGTLIWIIFVQNKMKWYDKRVIKVSQFYFTCNGNYCIFLLSILSITYKILLYLQLPTPKLNKVHSLCNINNQLFSTKMFQFMNYQTINIVFNRIKQ